MNDRDFYAGIAGSIDLPSRRFSLLFVTPKEQFLGWVQEYMKRKGLEKYRLYVPEENTVMVIPKIDYFSEPTSFEKFLADIKPKLLSSELARVRASKDDLKRPLSVETFDEFFEISLRDSVMLVSDLVSGLNGS